MWSANFKMSWSFISKNESHLPLEQIKEKDKEQAGGLTVQENMAKEET